AGLFDPARDQVVRHALCPLQGEPQVVLIGAGRVGITANVDLRAGEVDGQDVGLRVQQRKKLGFQIELVDVEGDFLRIVEDEDLLDAEVAGERRQLGLIAELEDQLSALRREDPQALLDDVHPLQAGDDRIEVRIGAHVDVLRRVPDRLSAKTHLGLLRQGNDLQRKAQLDFFGGAGRDQESRENYAEKNCSSHVLGIIWTRNQSARTQAPLADLSLQGREKDYGSSVPLTPPLSRRQREFLCRR